MSAMRQQEPRSALRVAEFNPNPRWPSGYFEVLEEMGVPERERGFYAHWVRQFFNRFPGRKRRSLGPQEIAGFLDAILNEHVAASTQNQALNAVVFLYRDVLKQDVGDFSSFPRARRGKRLPVVCSRSEIQRLFAETDGVEGLIVRLLYGTGMRV